MQTTLTIDDDVLAAAMSLAAKRHQTVGEVISSLSRQSLPYDEIIIEKRNGVPLLPVRDSTPVTDEFVNQLKDELGI